MLQKAFAAGVIAAVIGIQAFMSVTGFGGTWYWPFQNYAMYSRARFATDSVFDYRLRTRPCSPVEAEPVSVAAQDVGMTVYKWREELEVTGAAIRPRPNPAILAERAGFIDGLVSTLPGDWCEIEVWEGAYPNTGAAAAARRAPWRLALRWPAGAGRDPEAWRVGERITPAAPPIASLPPLSESTISSRRRSGEPQ
jgi:hypothetical protein